MKVVLFLGILIGVLLCGLVYMYNHNSGAVFSSPHSKMLEKNSFDQIKTLCQNHIEYIIINGSGTSVITAVDKDGRPQQCEY